MRLTYWELEEKYINFPKVMDYEFWYTKPIVLDLGKTNVVNSKDLLQKTWISFWKHGKRHGQSRVVEFLS
jgi:hypothetical protein